MGVHPWYVIDPSGNIRTIVMTSNPEGPDTATMWRLFEASGSRMRATRKPTEGQLHGWRNWCQHN